MSNKIDLIHLETLPTLQEKAKYLLDFEITTQIQIVNLTPVLKSFIGDIGLPIHSKGNETSEDVIRKAKAWLKKQSQSHEVVTP
ncbi:hypothetical protein CJF42_25430 [Pseudoalteromonas sp. NBT06-2]|uniref:hypothetical protein n=1 Tax=Pseudoalteromonas sp. NBT06-2 TaxID=2025950 RepID=UPI000BA7B3D4|nr:hypothetical protein [Pseudoalteromonas sp. NBT06-2]PAJ71677.1 hypothetical protein CJF42_25430 [Pseudoalteromonas sp. NBT06-2]